MATLSEELKEHLLRSDTEFRQLAAEHSELDGRLHELTSKPYLTPPEQLEETTLKKRKLAVKDHMEAILRRTRARETPSLGLSQASSVH